MDDQVIGPRLDHFQNSRPSASFSPRSDVIRALRKSGAEAGRTAPAEKKKRHACENNLRARYCGGGELR